MTPKPISGLLEQFCTNVLREKRLLWYPIQLEMVNSDFVLLLKIFQILTPIKP